MDRDNININTKSFLSLESIGFIVWLVFLILKVTNSWDIPWFWVWFPLWIPIAIDVAIIIIAAVVCIIIVLVDN